jgi:hypothetical protein
MSAIRFSVSLVAIIGVMAATIAAATIWLLLTDPIQSAQAANALGNGDVTPFVAAVGSVIYGALRGLFKYL